MDTNNSSIISQISEVTDSVPNDEGSPNPDAVDTTLQYMLTKISQQEYHNELKYKIQVAIENLRRTRAEKKAALVVQAHLKKENDRLDKRHLEALARCKFIDKQVDTSMKVFNDSLNADSKNEARVMARQDELDKQWEEIVSLKQKLQDTRAKITQYEKHNTSDDAIGSSQKPVNIASDLFFEAETRMKSTEIDLQTIQQKLSETKSEVADLQALINEKDDQIKNQKKQSDTHQATIAEITPKITELQHQTTQITEELVRQRQQSQTLQQEIDQLYTQRVQSRVTFETEMNEISQQLKIVRASLLPTEIGDKIKNIYELLAQLKDPTLLVTELQSGGNLSEMDRTIPETETEENDKTHDESIV